MGVRLTPAGERLAALVLRRHRLIEQFLVQVLGMNWSEVHDEAERLEHAVSERLIDRIDEMLGRPAVDPHGDPIPGREGELAAAQLRRPAELSGSSAPLLVTRVTDQDAKFLRFIEERAPQARSADRDRHAGPGVRQRDRPERRPVRKPPSAPAPPPKSSSSSPASDTNRQGSDPRSGV